MAAILFNHKANEYAYLSNFYPCLLVIDGVRFPSVEHYFQAAKFSDKTMQDRVRAAATAKAAKKLGRTRHESFNPGWNNVRVEVMERAVKAKFEQNRILLSLLVGTDNTPLLENNRSDAFWGIGRNGKGRNTTGTILMKIRDELRERTTDWSLDGNGGKDTSAPSAPSNES